MDTGHDRNSLVIAERGSGWGRWLGRSDARPAEGPALVLQRSGESDADFAQRVRSRVAELEGARSLPKRVVLVGGRAREGALSSRSLMIRAIANGMARSGGGELLLDNHGSDRFTMRALAETVSDMVRGSGVEVAHTTSTGTPAPAEYREVA